MIIFGGDDHLRVAHGSIELGLRHLIAGDPEMDTISAEQRGAGMRKTFANIDAIIALCSCVRALIRRMPGTFKGRTRLRIRDAFIASLLGIVGYAGTASANSCANVDVMGSFDESGLRENASGIYAAGTFRIAGEEDESKQPMFNLAMINCEKSDDASASFECKITKAVVWAQSGNPNPDNPNCSLDLDASAYQMKELQRGILSGIETTTQCFNSMLTIDRNTKRVYLSFTRTTYADNYDKIRPGTCGMSPRTQVLMNCTGWPRMRKQGRAPPRYCDFSSSKDK